MEKKRGEKRKRTASAMNVHPNLNEFREMAPYDGIVVYSSYEIDKVIKVKPFSLLTVDLQYDGNSIFLDAESNVYTISP